MKPKIKRGDQVVVIAGADKGRRGEVLGINRKTERVKVQGIAMRKFHRKARSQEEEGGIFEEEGTVHYSNLMHAGRFDERRARKGLPVPAAPTAPEPDAPVEA